MLIFKCKMCGGTLEIRDGESVAVCEYCGTKQTLPKSGDDVIANLFNRANNLRLRCEFDKAEQIYEKIVQLDDGEAEAHWGIVLCKYGIEYVEDPKTLTRIPTCHRTLYDAVSADPDYLAAIEHSDAACRALYEAEAKEIDRIQKNVLEIVKEEKPFDVFICYKETDENGRRTVDSTIANDVYYQLTQEGFKVFYAAITLEDKIGREYEPYIFAALSSAKVMLVLGTKPEYFNAVWVKNEWSRYLKLMKDDRSRLLIPCYRDMDAYDLPEEFAHLQAQDMGKIGFVNDLLRGIRKVLTADAPKAEGRETVVASANANVASLLERAFLFLEDGKWKDANIYCEKVLDIDPKSAEAYLGKLMAELQVRSRQQLADCAAPFDGLDNYGKVLRFGDEKLEAELRGYIEHIKERNENTRLTGIYNNAKNAMNAANTEDAFKAAAETFAMIPGFKDADTLAEQCLDKAEICRKDAIYASAKSNMIGEKVAPYEEAIEVFQTISGWKDADEQIYACQKKIEEIKVKEEANRLEAERKAEERRIAAEKAAKKRKKAFAIGTPIACVVIVFIIILNNIIIPNVKYDNAVKLMEAENYEEAISAFKALDGYRDSAAKIDECNTAILDIKYNDAVSLMDSGNIIEAFEALTALEGYRDSADKAKSIFYTYIIEKLKIAHVGDIVYFGSYEQDNNTSNGKEDIEWIVLAKENGKALVISKYALDCQQYNTSYADVTWETCSLRKWMNGTFLNNAFSTDEQAKIAPTNVCADKNPKYSTNSGNTTTDKVFLLSITEAEKYLTTNESRKCAPTAYAKAQGAWTSGSSKTASGEATCWWWLRSPGRDQHCASTVSRGGAVGYSGRAVDYDHGAVRPALWINLDS